MSRELDKKVATALGWSVAEVPITRLTTGRSTGYVLRDAEGRTYPKGGGVYGWGRTSTEENAWGQCPYFSTSPFASELVIKEIERRGWGLAMYNELQNGKRTYQAYLQNEGQEWGGIGTANSYESLHEALCLAFLAAVEATKEQAQ